MTNEHLKKGDPRPAPVEAGKLRLYSMKYCPYAHRVRLVLQAKGAPFDVVNIDLSEKPEWITEVNPQGKVPALEIGEEVVVESLDIADYLDGKFSDPKLWPEDDATRTRHKQLISDISKVTAALNQVLYSKDQQLVKRKLEEIATALRPYEDELATAGTTFFGGNRPGMLDYMMWPWGERSHVPCAIHEDIDFPTGKFPKLVAWREAMKSEPAVKAQSLSVEEHVRYIRGESAGKQDNDASEVQACPFPRRKTKPTVSTR